MRKICLRSVNQHRRRTGFLLVLVIAMLAIITLTTVQLANMTMRQAILARDAEQQLQAHWRNLTLERVAFQHAPALLEATSQEVAFANRTQALPSAQVLVRIGSKDFSVTIQDESGKLPLGALLEAFPPSQVTEAARPLLDPSLAFRDLGEQPLPSRPSNLTQLVFSENAFPDFVLVSRKASQRLTLAGRDKLSLANTDQETLDVLWHILFDKPAPRSLLMGAVANHNHVESLSLAGLRESELAIARQWTTNRSDVYGVWIEQVRPTYIPQRQTIRWGAAPYSYATTDY